MDEAGPSGTTAPEEPAATAESIAYASRMLAEAELRLESATKQEQETDAMLLLARREREELKEANKELREQQDKLRSRITAKRRGKAEIAQMGHFSEAYDWVCEITKLSDVGTSGWTVTRGAA